MIGCKKRFERQQGKLICGNINPINNKLELCPKCKEILKENEKGVFEE